MTNSVAHTQKTDLNSFSICSNSDTAGQLESAIKLWRRNSATLGRFPKGAFEDAAHRKWIRYLIKDEQVVGYVLYRSAKNRIAIAHLCIAEEVRGCGAAKFLFEEFCKEADDGHCRGIEVRCRDDFEVNRLWPKLGFQHSRTVPGRAKEGSFLSVWFKRFDIEDFFFDMLPKKEDDDLTWAILDANVVFKLSTPDDETSEESLSLISDTISPYTRFFITHEIFTEIQRKNNRSDKERSTRFAKKFEQLEARQASIDHFAKLLEPIWKSIRKDRDRSDLKHVAITAAAGVQTFITLDTGILEKADEIYNLCSVQVMLPVAFITQLDEIENLGKYSPQSPARTQFSTHCPKPEEITSIAEQFCIPHLNEKQKKLEAKLRAQIANTKEYKTILVTSEGSNYEALLSFRITEDILSIELMRTTGSTASRTIAQNIVWDIIGKNSPAQISTIVYSDAVSQKLNEDALKAMGFFPNDKNWAKVTATLTAPLNTARRELCANISTDKSLSLKSKQALEHFINLECKSCSNLEVAFWPLKITNTEIPTYLVPIKPNWAMNLFDSRLSEQDLLGADPGKHFSYENVYYRSPKPFNAVPGARIVWYVSGSNQGRVSEIRACSRLISSETAPAKTLFSKYRRLGIYQWIDLMERTGGDAYGEITAFRFHQTEYFKKPIKLSDFHEYGINGQPFGPHNLSQEQFEQIYATGMKIHEQ